MTGSRFAVPMKPATKAVAGLVVDLGRGADLVDPTLGHDRDAVRHRQGLLLVVGDEDEGDADLALDALQLELHDLAELQVERAERLVEQQGLGQVDQGTGERDALLLAAGELVRLAFRHVGQADDLEQLHHPLDLTTSLGVFLLRRPNATFSNTFMWGNSA